MPKNFRRFIDAEDYRKQNSWSIDRIKFEIDEIDKAYPFLTNICEELTEHIIFCNQMKKRHREAENFDVSEDFSKEGINTLCKLEEYEKQIIQNWERREELVKVLRNKL